MRFRDGLIWLGVALILLPALITPAGWIVGAVLALVWLLATYGSAYLLDLERHRREGERGMIKEVRQRSRREDRK